MSESDNKERADLPPAAYMEHRNSLQKTLHDQAASFDKNILTLSSGAIALSLIFIEKVTPDPTRWTEFALAAAWASFALAILSTLASFLTSQKTHKALIEEWDETYRQQESPSGNLASEGYDRRTRWLNSSSAAFFIAGVGLLVIFAIGNL